MEGVGLEGNTKLNVGEYDAEDIASATASPFCETNYVSANARGFLSQSSEWLSYLPGDK
jgi:hypothetical protein